MDKEAKTPEQFITSLITLRQDPKQAANIDYAIYALIDRLMLERVKFEETSDEQQQAAIAEYAPWLLAGSTVVRGLRNSLRWIDQEFADRLEIIIIDALTSPELNEYHSNDEIQAAVSMLPDRARRNASRRAAVLASWSKSNSQRGRERQAMGGISFDVYEHPSLIYYFDLWKRKQEAIVATAIDALRDDTTSNQRPWQRRMHDLIAPPDLRFKLGPYSSRFRDLPAMEVLRLETTYPARYWGMNWETELEKLKATLSASRSNQSAEPKE